MKQDRIDRFMWDDPDEIIVHDEPTEPEKQFIRVDRFVWDDPDEIIWLDGE